MRYGRGSSGRLRPEDDHAHHGQHVKNARREDDVVGKNVKHGRRAKETKTFTKMEEANTRPMDIKACTAIAKAGVRKDEWTCPRLETVATHRERNPRAQERVAIDSAERAQEQADGHQGLGRPKIDSNIASAACSPDLTIRSIGKAT